MRRLNLSRYKIPKPTDPNRLPDGPLAIDRNDDFGKLITRAYIPLRLNQARYSQAAGARIAAGKAVVSTGSTGYVSRTLENDERLQQAFTIVLRYRLRSTSQNEWVFYSGSDSSSNEYTYLVTSAGSSLLSFGVRSNNTPDSNLWPRCETSVGYDTDYHTVIIGSKGFSHHQLWVDGNLEDENTFYIGEVMPLTNPPHVEGLGAALDGSPLYGTNGIEIESAFVCNGVGPERVARLLKDGLYRGIRSSSPLTLIQPAAGGGTTVSATTDALVLSENSATLDFSLTITSSVDALVITGNASTISFAKTVTVTTDPLSLTENQATLDFTLTVSTTVDALILTENQSTVSTALLITNTVESLTLTENQATLDFTLTITGSSDSLVITENNASIQVGGVITASTDSLLLVENASTLDFSLTVTGSTDSLTLTENQSTVSFNVTITSSTDSLSLTENDTTVDTQLTVSNTLDTLVIAANDATVTTSAAITAGTIALVITENQGTIDTQLTVVSTTEELTIASNDAEIFTTAGQYILGFSSTITSVPMVYVLARTGDNMYVFRHVEDGGTEEIINTGVVASGTDNLMIDVTTDNPRLYVDGALVATSSLSMANTTVSYHGVGALIQSSVTSHMTGRIWDVAYTDPNDGTNSALFPINEGTGSTLTDSLNGDTATVINFDADMWV